MRRIALLLLPLAFTPACEPAPPPPVHELRIESPIYRIDRIFRSMKGPWAQRQLTLLDQPEPELVWIVGYRTEVVQPKGAEAGESSPEFMCHSNLGMGDVKAHRKAFGWRKRVDSRLFTLSQGQMEVRFPQGFGIPMLSNEPLDLLTMVLNLNPLERPIQVRHETTIEFVRDRDATEPMKPLFQRAAQGLVLVKGDEPYFGVRDADPEVHGPGCAVGMPAGEKLFKDRLGREFAAHWVVEPGRETNRTLVTRGMELPFDTTIHYISVHLHPFAESIELRDLTLDETIFKSRAENTEGRIGLERVESFSSEIGIPLYSDHEYELVSVYDNPTDQDQDSMAVLFMYLLDREFERPSI